MSEHRYVLNRNEGIDTLHRDPREECNVDDADDREVIDQATAMSMSINGQARLCSHCYPADEDPA